MFAYNDKILSESQLIICSRCKKQTTFSGQKIGRIRVNKKLHVEESKQIDLDQRAPLGES